MIHWFEKSAEQGRPEVLYNLAMCYEKDEIKAGELFIRSYEKDCYQNVRKIFENNIYTQMYVLNRLENKLMNEITNMENRLNDKLDEVLYAPNMRRGFQLSCMKMKNNFSYFLF